MDKFLQIQFTKTELWRNSLNWPVTNKETESVIKNISTKKSPGLDGFHSEFYQTCKEEWMSSFSLLQKTKEVTILPNLFYEAIIMLTFK